MKFKYYIGLLSIGFAMACGSPEKTNSTLKNGKWEAELKISTDHPDRVLPFEFEITHDEVGAIALTFLNGGEKIPVTSILETKDSLLIEMPVFQSVFKAKKHNNKKLTGEWINLNKKDYAIPFEARAFEVKRGVSSTNHDITGNWDVTFDYDTDGAYPAVGIFTQRNNKLKGSFLTETGDYRYLSGAIEGNDFWLATFDGAHAFLFEAELNAEKEMTGMFYSGKHYKSPWKAVYNENAKLQHADSLTTLTSKTQKPTFSFPNTKGSTTSLDDDAFKNKVVILQLMGSWCPNCMDETRFYKELYQQYNKQGLEIIGLGFEYSKDPEVAMKALQKMEKDLAVPYSIAHAGPASKKEAARLFPMLNHVISFPTSIFLDKNGTIRKIHTGFNGPGTGSHYDTYAKETHQFIQELLEENAL